MEGPPKIVSALGRLQDKAREADHAGRDYVVVDVSDLIVALEQLDGAGIINLYLD